MRRNKWRRLWNQASAIWSFYVDLAARAYPSLKAGRDARPGGIWFRFTKPNALAACAGKLQRQHHQRQQRRDRLPRGKLQHQRHDDHAVEEHEHD